MIDTIELSEQHNLKFINQVYLREIETKISDMSWYNVLRRAGSDYCVNDNFPGTFADFRLKIFTQEKITSYGDPCP